MQTAKRVLLIFLAVSGLSMTPATAFTVDPPSQNRSSLVRLRGPGFGATQGTVTIAGLPVPIAHWDDILIECYVPKQHRWATPKLLSRHRGAAASAL